MPFNFDELDQLTSLQASGILSPEGEQRLHHMITTDRDAYDTWKMLHERYNSEHTKNLKFDEQAILARIREKTARTAARKRILLYRTSGLVAALIVCTLGVVYFMVVREVNKPVPHSAVIADNRDQGIQLTTPAGQHINLSNTQGQVSVGSATLQNTNKTLSYSLSGKAPAGWAMLTVPIGKDYKVQLSDGTEIWLNSATALRFPFSFNEDKREVTISGEAYIKVAQDPVHPFLVHLPYGTVQVLGTEFNVNTYDSSQAKVSLVSGSIKMQLPAGGNARLLKTGQQAVVSRQSSAIQLQPFDENITLSWRRGIFYFEDMTLAEICQVMPRWFGIEAVMDNNRIAQRRYTGVLNRNKPIEQQLEYFLTSNDVKYYFDQGGVLHFK